MGRIAALLEEMFAVPRRQYLADAALFDMQMVRVDPNLYGCVIR